MVFNATFNNISVISWTSVLLVEETRVPGENHPGSVASSVSRLVFQFLIVHPIYKGVVMVVIVW
jgi:hypothetical protein